LKCKFCSTLPHFGRGSNFINYIKILILSKTIRKYNGSEKIQNNPGHNFSTFYEEFINYLFRRLSF